MAETTTVSCPNCKQTFRVPNEKLGRTFKCTKCAQPFVAAAPGAPAAPAAPSAPAMTPPSVRPRPPVVSPPAVAEQDPDQEQQYTDPAGGYAGATPGYASAGLDGPPKMSVMAILSLVFSLLGCLSPLGLVFGFIGLSKTKNGRARGRRLAIAGIIISCLTIIASIAAGVYVWNQQKQIRNHFKSADNLKTIFYAMSAYETAYKAYPPDLATLAKTQKVDLSLFAVPGTTDTPASTPDQIESGGHCSYVYIGKDVPIGTFGSLSGHYVLMYEGGSEHPFGNCILFDDGAVDSGSKGAAADSIIEASKKAVADQKKKPVPGK